MLYYTPGDLVYMSDNDYVIVVAGINIWVIGSKLCAIDSIYFPFLTGVK